MIIKRMRWDQKQTFNKCFIDNGNGTFSIAVTMTSGGVKANVSGRRDVMDTFHKTLVNSRMQVST